MQSSELKATPTVCNHFERKQEAEDWAADVERQIKQGKFKFDQHKQQHTFTQLLERYINDGALRTHPISRRCDPSSKLLEIPIRQLRPGSFDYRAPR